MMNVSSNIAFSARITRAKSLHRAGDVDRAIELNPKFAEAHNNRGVALKVLRRFDESLSSYERALALKPEFVDATWNRALLHLLREDFATGWTLYESRRALKPHRTFAQPLWLGDQPVNGKTVLIYAEQGLGDVIQFCRYIPMLVQLHCRVVVEVPAILMSLLSTLKAECRLIEWRTFTPIHVCDVRNASRV